MIKNSLHYLKLAAQYGQMDPENFSSRVSVNLITNFTDDILKKILLGMLLDENIYPRVRSAPYKQYHLYLKNFTEDLTANPPNLTFVFFDVNHYVHSEFSADEGHFSQILSDLRAYIRTAQSTVVLSLGILPYRGPYGNLHTENPLYRAVEAYNAQLRNLAKEFQNAQVFDTNAVVHVFGEFAMRDFRGLYSADLPFSTEFSVQLAHAWIPYIRGIIGRARKCIVVDLDNTLWGGIVGEVGPLGIELGSAYPGNAFQNFQRALREFAKQGVILAVNSRNNSEDIAEVFLKNPHMLLQEKDFAALRINWKQKDENLREIAEELNIGLDSMVFIDDDPFNRELVRQNLPEVLVPEFSLPPEEYVKELFSWNVFSQSSLTDEDRRKTLLYAQERERKLASRSSQDIDAYIAGLQIRIDAEHNPRADIPRLAQLTQKTNQFNLTTRRYTEADIARFMDEGCAVYAGRATDRFGEYGLVLLAIICPSAAAEAVLDTYLMSCRALGRGIEFRFFDHVIRDAAQRGVLRLHASFKPTAKNEPAKEFLSKMSFVETSVSERGDSIYILDIPEYLTHPPVCVNPAISITSVQ